MAVLKVGHMQRPLSRLLLHVLDLRAQLDLAQRKVALHLIGLPLTLNELLDLLVRVLLILAGLELGDLGFNGREGWRAHLGILPRVGGAGARGRGAQDSAQAAGREGFEEEPSLAGGGGGVGGARNARPHTPEVCAGTC